MKRFLWLGFVLFVYLVMSRVRRYVPPDYYSESSAFPNPAATNTVVSINDNAPLWGNPRFGRQRHGDRCFG